MQVCPFAPACGGRLLSDKCRTVVSKDGISRCFGEGDTEGRAAKADRKARFQRSGPAACLQAVAPTGISRRDSLPPLNAMPVVQVSQAVQRVLRNRDVVDAGRSHVAPTCGGRLLSEICRTGVSKDGISRCFGEGDTEGRAAKADRKARFQRSGACDLPSGGRADGHKQAGFTPAVKRNARRASFAGCTASLAQPGRCGRRALGGEVRSPRTHAQRRCAR